MITFDSVQCSKKWCLSLFDELFSKSSESLLDSMSVRLKQTSGVRVRSSIDEHVQVRYMFENDVQICSMFDEMVFDPSLVGGILCYIAF